MENAPTMLLPIELSSAGVARARRELDRVDAILGGERGNSGQSAASEASGRLAVAGQTPDVVIVYEHARTIPESRTSDLLELFAREDLLTPEEIGVALGNGQPLTKAQGRAFIRNLSRMEGHLFEQGRITGRVLVKEFADYEREGAGRYGFSDEDRQTLRGHVGI